jgi:tetratricopeptide (TPR) repeat protein
MVAMIFAIGIFIVAVLMRSPKDRHLSGGDYNLPAGSALNTGETTLSLADHINRGNELLAQYEFDKALGHFQEALKLKSNDPSIHFKIGRIFLQKEDHKNATLAFRNVLNLNPQQMEAYYELARIAQAQDNLEQAHQELNQALGLNPEHEETLKLKVKLYEQEEKYLQALPSLRKLVTISRYPMKYRAMTGEFLLSAGRPEEGIAEYESLVELDPENRTHYRHKIAQAHLDAGNYDQAIEFFKLVLHEQGPLEDAENQRPIKNKLATALCNEGVRLFEEEQFDTAIQRYQEAVLYDDTNADIHYNLGKAYLRTKETMKALSHFEKAIVLNPQDAASYYELALLQDEKGMLKEAIGNYETVLSLEPDNLNAVFGLGTLYGVQGELDKAIQYLSDAIRINPQYVDAVYNLAVALERKKDFNKASQMYRKVLSLDPEHEKARGNLAHLKHLQTHEH